MEFGLSEDQKLLQDSVGKVIEKASSLERVRQAAEQGEAFPSDIRQALTELGVPGIIVPEQYGGMALSLLDAALVAEVLGRHVAPAPFIGSTVLATLAIEGAGSKSQKDKWLSAIASGELVVGVAISEAASGRRDGAGVESRNGKLNGTALFVLDDAEAGLYVVADIAGGLHIVAGNAPGLSRVLLTSIDLTRPLTELRFENVEAEPLATGNAVEVLDCLIAAGRVLLSADTLGASWMMIERAVSYAAERKQFGRVIGSFQAVKHMCAEMAAEIEPCRSLVWYAAYAFDNMPDEAALMAAHAKSLTSEAGRFVARTATEVHGGMGFTDLLGLHFWFKRIGLNRQLLGSPERVRQEAARMQGWVAA